MKYPCDSLLTRLDRMGGNIDRLVGVFRGRLGMSSMSVRHAHTAAVYSDKVKYHPTTLDQEASGLRLISSKLAAEKRPAANGLGPASPATIDSLVSLAFFSLSSLDRASVIEQTSLLLARARWVFALHRSTQGGRILSHMAELGLVRLPGYLAMPTSPRMRYQLLE